MGDGERDERKKGGIGENELSWRNKRNQAKVPYEDKTRQMTLKWVSLSLFFFLLLSPPFSHSRLPSPANITSLDAFHSPLAVPARTYSVKPIYIRKWPFLAFPPHSPLPSLRHLFSHRSQLFIFLTECIWAWMKAQIYQQGHLSTYLREKKGDLLHPI